MTPTRSARSTVILLLSILESLGAASSYPTRLDHRRDPGGAGVPAGHRGDDRHAVGGDRGRASTSPRRDVAFRLWGEHGPRRYGRHAPAAQPVGIAALADHRFIITADGYASVAPALAHTVHGVLWRMTPRDRITLDTWENVAGKLYRAEMFPVRQAPASGPPWSTWHGRAAWAGRRRAIWSSCSRRRAHGICRAITSRRCSVGCCARPAGAGARKLEDIRVDVICTGRHPRPRAGRRLSRLDRIYRARARPAGWVRNRRDGSVEAVFAGPPAPSPR